MSDIVEELRDDTLPFGVREGYAAAAADEIERLRADLAEVLDSVRVAAKALNDEERENERLRGLLRWWVDAGPNADWDDYEKRVREALGE